MSTLLLAELARENAASNQRIANSVKTNAQGENAAGNVREAIRYTLRQAAEAQGLWQGTMSLFQDGLEGGAAREVLQLVRHVFTSWFDLEQATRNLWTTSVRFGAAGDGLQELESAFHEVEGLKAAAQAMETFLSQPRTTVDPAMLEKGRQAVLERRFKSPEEMRAGQK
jgi:hypothetical protein